MQLQDLTEHSHELLERVISGVLPQGENETGADKFRRKFILHHANCISQVALDVLDLEDRKRVTSPPLLVRGMLENLFVLGAAARKKDFALQKVIYDFEKTADYARLAAKKSSSEDLKTSLEEEAGTFVKIGKELRERNQIAEREKFDWSPVKCAVEAGLLRQYAQQYANFSKATHGEFSSLIVRELGWTSVNVIRVVAFICLEAVGFLTSSVETIHAERIEGQRKWLFGALAKLEHDGTINELRHKEMNGEPAVNRGQRKTRLQQN